MAIKEGWLCPRCQKVNNPDNKTCDCKENCQRIPDVPYVPYIPIVPYEPYPLYPIGPIYPMWKDTADNTDNRISFPNLIKIKEEDK